MTPHISAKKNQIFPQVLITGDPLRATHIAEKILVKYEIVSKVRGNNIYSGVTQDGIELTVMASGMGMASIGIYSEELFKFYRVDRVIRIGTCGSYQKKVKVGDVIVPISACTDSKQNRLLFDDHDYSPTAGTDLLYRTMSGYIEDKHVHFGIINSSDFFYMENAKEYVSNLVKGGVVGVEMETATLYTTAKRYDKEALSILLVSDSLVDPKARSMSAKERETKNHKNVEIALSTLALKK